MVKTLLAHRADIYKQDKVNDELTLHNIVCMDTVPKPIKAVFLSLHCSMEEQHWIMQS